jgi:hypothetical protein
MHKPNPNLQRGGSRRGRKSTLAFAGEVTPEWAALLLSQSQYPRLSRFINERVAVGVAGVACSYLPAVGNTAAGTNTQCTLTMEAPNFKLHKHPKTHSLSPSCSHVGKYGTRCPSCIERGPGDCCPSCGEDEANGWERVNWQEPHYCHTCYMQELRDEATALIIESKSADVVQAAQAVLKMCREMGAPSKSRPN